MPICNISWYFLAAAVRSAGRSSCKKEPQAIACGFVVS